MPIALGPQAHDASRGPLGAYLARVARHTLAAQWRQARRQVRREEPWSDEMLTLSSRDFDPRIGEINDRLKGLKRSGSHQEGGN